jgi:hypothetical protein
LFLYSPSTTLIHYFTVSGDVPLPYEIFPCITSDRMSSSTGMDLSQDNFCTPSNSEFYKTNPYSDLDPSKREIRLLQLSPVEEGIPLHANLVTISLDSPDVEDLSFVAISYAAGNHLETESIYIDGNLFNSFANLARALRQVAKARDKSELQHIPRLIWADQICINQSNRGERSHQVGFMRNIYECAGAVLACLGDDYSNGRCIRVAKRLKSWSVRDIELEDAKIFIEGRMVADFHNEEFQDDWRALAGLLSSSWWQRGWIYQEVVVARQVFVLFGDSILDWDTLSNTAQIFQRVLGVYISNRSTGRESSYQKAVRDLIASGLNSDRANFMIKGREDWENMKERNLIGLLAQAQMCKVSDKRDRIFAFIGLANPNYGIVPDYTTSTQATFQMVCQRIILFERNLNVLTCCKTDWDEEPRISGLPS